MKRLIFKAAIGKKGLQSEKIVTNTSTKRTFFDFSDDELKKLKPNKPKEPEVVNTPTNESTTPPTDQSSTSSSTTTNTATTPNHQEKDTIKPSTIPKKSARASANPSEPLFGECLNYKAHNNLIEVETERNEEINKLINVLSNVESHSNVILVGENGIGRRSIVESLAHRIAKQPSSIPQQLRNTNIIELLPDNLYGNNNTNNICTTFFHALKSLKVYDAFDYDNPPNPKLMTIPQKKSFIFGNNPPPSILDEDVERTFNETVESIKTFKSNRAMTQQPKILFIHQFYQMVDDFSYSFYDSISTVLQPLLEKNKIKLITCMTPAEYSKFTKNSLNSYFETIKIEETDFATTLKIAEKKKETLQAAHGVIIGNDIIEETLLMSTRYIPSKSNPMKCISILDEVASVVEKRNLSTPPIISTLETKIKKQSIEIDKKSDNLSNIKELNKLKESYASNMSEWKAEKESLETYKQNKLNLLYVKKELSDCISTIKDPECDDAKRAATIIGHDLPELMKKIRDYEKQSLKNKYINNRATLDDLAFVISRMANIHQSDIYFTSQKNHSLANTESILASQIIGQQQAISSVSKSIRIAKLGLGEETKPQASFLFCGYSGTGKTELAKQIAKVVYGNQKSCTVIDMTKYNTEYSVSGLIGTSAGYIGFEEGGELTNALKKNPFQVIVFDEIEKAHTRIWNVLLPMLEEGTCQNNYGENISLKNTIIVLTSNAGTKRLFQGREEDRDLTKNEIFHEEIKETFSPEFLNRLDDIIIFNELSMEDLDKILTIQLEKLEKRLSKKKEIKVELSNDARQFLTFNSFDIQYGARPIKRNIQNYVVSPISDLFYEGKLNKHCTLKFDVEGKSLKVEIVVDEAKESKDRRRSNLLEQFDELVEFEEHYKHTIISLKKE